MGPVASIVIPAHNAAGFVADAIASAQAQTLRDIEIVVVDDASTDVTWDIVTAAAARDRRIVPLRRRVRGGASGACNLGFGMARGRWVAQLDADDLFLPRRLERLVHLAEAVGADLLADDLLRRDFVTGAELGRQFGEAAMRGAGPLSLGEMLRRDMPGQPTRLGFVQPIKRREFLARTGVRFAEDVAVAEDFLFYFECVARGARFHLTPEAHYVYRVRQGSLSNGGAPAAARHVSRANRRMLAIASGLGDPGLVRQLRARQRALDFGSLAEAAQAGRYLDALSYLSLGGPAHLVRQLRTVAGAARRNSGTARVGGLARAD